MAAAIATLAQGEGEAWLVLGDMAELGEGAAALHSDAGLLAKRAGLTRLWTVGSLSRAASVAFGAGGVHHDSREELVAALNHALQGSGDRRTLRVLVKGSRSSAMDKVVSALLALDNQETGHAA